MLEQKGFTQSVNFNKISFRLLAINIGTSNLSNISFGTIEIATTVFQNINTLESVQKQEEIFRHITTSLVQMIHGSGTRILILNQK